MAEITAKQRMDSRRADFPEFFMPTLYEREEHLFLEALDVAAGPERDRFLHECCGEDAALRDRLRALLAHHDSRHGCLDETMVIAAGDKSDDDLRGTLGNYRIDERLGEGGMGIVYVADQLEPIKRRVAIKIIRLGMDSHSVMARFQSERHLLARMDHPSITQIFDAGVTGRGRPYFVDGTRRRAPDHRLLPGTQAVPARAAGTRRPRLQCHPARAPERHCPSRPETLEHSRQRVARCRTAQSDRLRGRQSHRSPHGNR